MAARGSRVRIAGSSKYTGLPTLIDVHTHMTMYTDETPGEPILKQLAANPPAVEVFLARKGALRTLEAGVTSTWTLPCARADPGHRENRTWRGTLPRACAATTVLA